MKGGYKMNKVSYYYEDIPIDKRYEVGEIVRYFVEISKNLSEEIRAIIIYKRNDNGERYLVVAEIKSGLVKLLKIDESRYLFNETKAKKGYWY